MTLEAAIDSLIQLLEARIPANPASPENVKAEKVLQKDMARYFGQLEQAVSEDTLAQIYLRNVKPE